MHSISVYLIRKEDLRDEKLDSILENKSNHLKLTQLGEGIYATTNKPKDWGNRMICHITTDYFGGPGEQSADLRCGNDILLKNHTKFDPFGRPINQALKLMGVKKKDGMDEFDTIGLGRYRTNEDFK